MNAPFKDVWSLENLTHLVVNTHGAPHVETLDGVEEYRLGPVHALEEAEPVLETGNNSLLATFVGNLWRK